MPYKFSPSTGAHYPDHIDYPEGAIPADAIDVSDDEFAIAMAREPFDTLEIKRGKLRVVRFKGPTLDHLKANRVRALRADYARAVAAGVTYTTAAGQVAQFDPARLDDLEEAIAAGRSAWRAGLWLDVSGAIVAPFTFTDLQGLRLAIMARRAISHLDLLEVVAQVHAATSADDVAAVVLL